MLQLYPAGDRGAKVRIFTVQTVLDEKERGGSVEIFLKKYVLIFQ
jgi:hypothetical protein